jgi:hypothetical protein
MWPSIRVAALAVLFGASSCAAATLHAQQFKYAQSDGCAHVFLYGWNADSNEVLVVKADREQLGLPVGTTTLALADARMGLEVYVDLYARPLSKVDYCTDIKMPGQDRPAATLRARSGQLTLTLGERGAVKGRQPFMYEASVTLRDLTFVRADGTVVSVKGPITLKAVVGYVHG